MIHFLLVELNSSSNLTTTFPQSINHCSSIYFCQLWLFRQPAAQDETTWVPAGRSFQHPWKNIWYTHEPWNWRNSTDDTPRSWHRFQSFKHRHRCHAFFSFALFSSSDELSQLSWYEEGDRRSLGQWPQNRWKNGKFIVVLRIVISSVSSQLFLLKRNIVSRRPKPPKTPVSDMISPFLLFDQLSYLCALELQPMAGCRCRLGKRLAFI